jgi:hypothetical protein
MTYEPRADREMAESGDYGLYVLASRKFSMKIRWLCPCNKCKACVTGRDEEGSDDAWRESVWFLLFFEK